MNEALIRNPDVLSEDNTGTTTGRTVFGIRKGDGRKLTDFGLIESLDFNRESETKELTGNRDGRNKVYKKVKDGETLTMTFQTSATGNPEVREWFLGSRPLVTDLASAAFQPTHDYLLNDVIVEAGRLYRVTTAGESAAAEPVWPTVRGTSVQSGTATFTDIGTEEENELRAFEDAANINRGGLIVVLSTDEGDGNRSLVRVYPNTDTEGTGEPDIQDFDGYEFEVSISSNGGWVPPASLGNFATRKPDGVIYDVPNGRLEEVTNLLAASLIAYVDPVV